MTSPDTSTGRSGDYDDLALIVELWQRTRTKDVALELADENRKQAQARMARKDAA